MLTRAGLTDAALAVDLSVSEAGGGDFVDADKESAMQTVTFGAGVARTSYSPITNDRIDEGHGTVTVTVESGTDYEADAGAAAAAAAVRDDDGATLLTVSLEPSSLTVSEDGAAQFEVAAETVFDETFTAAGDLDRVFGVHNLPVTVSSTDGTAKSGDGDYEKKDTTTTVVFADFSPSGTGSARGLRGRFATATFEAYDDKVDDAGETFNVGIRFSGTVDGRIALGAANSVATIVEGPSVTLTPSLRILTEGDTATLTATVDPVHDKAFTATLTAVSDRIEFPAGATFHFAADAASASATLTVGAVNNDVDEPDAVDVQIVATVSDAAAVAAPAPTMLTVLDDDEAATVIALEVNPSSVAEGADATRITVTATLAGTIARATATAVAVTVGDGTATVGDDYDAVAPFTVTIGERRLSGTGTLTFTPTDDLIDEPNETVTVSGTAAGFAVAAAVVAIEDDDLPQVSIAAPQIALDTGYLFEHEADDPDYDHRWVLTRAGLTDAALAVDLSVSEAGGGDFVDADKESAMQTVTFGAGVARTSYSPITNDRIDEATAR